MHTFLKYRFLKFFNNPDFLVIWFAFQKWLTNWLGFNSVKGISTFFNVYKKSYDLSVGSLLCLYPLFSIALTMSGYPPKTTKVFSPGFLTIGVESAGFSNLVFSSSSSSWIESNSSVYTFFSSGPIYPIYSHKFSELLYPGTGNGDIYVLFIS